MNALNVITLAQAKTYLDMTGIDGRDAEIETLIKTAVSLVEKYTDYRLYEREETFVTYGCKTEISAYPVTIDSVVDEDDAAVTYTERVYPLSLVLTAPKDSTVTMTVGYAEADIANIPQNLIQACYKWVTYLFENKDIYEVNMPLDVQLLLNQSRRSATI
jgi:hypothetical protein